MGAEAMMSMHQSRAFLTLLLSLLIAPACRAATGPPAAAPGSPSDLGKPTISADRRVYAHRLEPREHPDYDRRAVKPPTWETFGNRTRFTCLRGFAVENGQIIRYTDELDRFTRTHELGDVIWPSYPILFAKNLAGLAGELKRRGLYLFDLWGYVPGSGPGGYWQQFKAPPEALAMLASRLGERWLGTDIGEQDGRYIGGYASQMTPASASRFEQYLNFQRHFERMGDDLGHRHAALVSLNFGHYLLKEGTYTLIGAETAQALPNNQVYYAFIRGAGKQYGVPWFGNASVYNRWGYKSYDSAGGSGGDSHGPTRGSSLSLLKRLLYSHILYNSVAVGFENGWFEADRLSPIGRIQQSALRWVKQNGPPGVMHTPVALLLDFDAGWTFPRHLYSGQVDRVWGNLPYGPGDYLTDAVLDMLYPGYQDSSYFHDESGFITPTPYGDIADCLLSDSPPWLLGRYPVVVVAGALTGGREMHDKLQAYVEGGGHLVITADNLAKLPGGLAGLATTPAISAMACGKGMLTLLPGAFGLEANPRGGGQVRSVVDHSLPRPYRLRPDVRATLDAVFRQQRLFEVGGRDLSLVTCRKGPGSYTLGIASNTWQERPLTITSLVGPIESLRVLPIDAAERDAQGFVPEGVAATALGRNTPTTIAGGDFRVFDVRVKETAIVEIAHEVPSPRPRLRALTLRGPRSIKEAILARPTFFEHFDGVVVDWRNLHERERAALQHEAGWINRQGLRVYVDLSSGIDLYPTLRLIDNDPDEYGRSMAVINDVLDKAKILGARDVILSLHRHPENNFSGEQTQAAFVSALQAICARAAGRGITLHLRTALARPPWNLGEMKTLLDRVGAKNLKVAASTAVLGHDGASVETVRNLKDRLGLWLVAGPGDDVTGTFWNAHVPVHRIASTDSIARWLSLAPDVPVASDAVLENQDEEYLEARALDRLGTTTRNPPR